MSPGGRERLSIGAPRRAGDPGRSRVEAEVDGETVWFESPDLDLVPAPEAWASAFLIPGLAHRVPLAVEAPLDPVWRAGVSELLGVLRGWWRYPALEPRSPAAGGSAGEAPARGGSTALFFSGGVDSFHTLLRGDRAVHMLVGLWGFDYPAADRVRHAAAERTLRAAAAHAGSRAAVIRTNVREHPRFLGVVWERVHGGVLGGIAHLLPDEVGEVLISSSISTQRDKPWGSHWRIDPLWSSSRRAIVPSGHELRRAEKLRLIAREPLLRDHLRVCWENRAPAGNCSRCYKCVVARLALADCGALESFTVFDGPETLAADVDGVPRGRDAMRLLRELADSRNLEPAVVAAVRRLIARTERLDQFPVRWRRAVIRRVIEWLQPARA